MQILTGARNHRSAARRGALAVLLALVATTAIAQDCAGTSSADAAAIRERRAAFNEAIAAKHIEVIARVLADDVVLVTGTDSDVFRGRDAQLAIWRDDFRSPHRAIYVRTPECISVFAVTPIALEHGRWRGERAAAPDNFAEGRYTAKWRRLAGEWQLEAEIFATGSCSGNFCPAAPATP